MGLNELAGITDMLKLGDNGMYCFQIRPSQFFVYLELKRLVAGRKFNYNEEISAETEAYIEAKAKTYYKNGIETIVEY